MQALKNKTRMLVTHHLQYLPYANQVIIMRRGEIVERGSYAVSNPTSHQCFSYPNYLYKRI
mgnify:CR=1 FL=1